jgi:hypothetical protein
LACSDCTLLLTDNELARGQINITKNQKRVKRLQTLCQKIKHQEYRNWLMICHSVSEKGSSFYKVPIDVLQVTSEWYRQKWDGTAYNCEEFPKAVIEWELHR